MQAGTQSWKAMLFGSLDPGNAITVDKPPAALWVMALSGRIFGFNSWSLLAPQAIEGVLSVWLTFAAVRRWSGPAAGLFAGAALALTPVAALMFRFDNPDALLVLLMVAGAYCVVRAIEKAGVRGCPLAGVAVGFAFLTKMLQGFLVLPAFAVVYLVAADTTLGRRIGARAGGWGGRGRVGRVVRGFGRAVAGRVAAVHRRFDQQQPVGTGVGLQRGRPHSRWWWQSWRWSRWR